MAQAVYSRRLLAWASDLSPAPFECPAGYVAVVRDADVVTNGGSIIHFALAISGVCTFWNGQFTIEAVSQHFQWQGRALVLPGETLAMFQDGVTDGQVSGYLLTLP